MEYKTNETHNQDIQQNLGPFVSCIYNQQQVCISHKITSSLSLESFLKVLVAGSYKCMKLTDTLCAITTKDCQQSTNKI